MRNKSVKFIVVCLGIILFSCGTDKGSKDENSEKVNKQAIETKIHTGGCVLCEPLGEIPEDLYQVTDVIKSDEFPPFTKKITSMGITLIGREEISDQFMINVALTIKAMFNPDGESIDRELQEEMIRNMYKYKAAIPLFLGHEFEMTEEEQVAMDKTRMKASICDIIMEAVPTQINEVVEHILHHVSDVGLHYTFPEEWGLTNTSRAHLAMKDAVDKGYYKIEDYSDIDGEDHNRVLIQEYAYWIIFDVWEMRETFFPRDAEFAVKTAADLKEKLPMSYDLVVETIPKVMLRPTDKLLIELFGLE